MTPRPWHRLAALGVAAALAALPADVGARPGGGQSYRGGSSGGSSSSGGSRSFSSSSSGSSGSRSYSSSSSGSSGSRSYSSSSSGSSSGGFKWGSSSSGSSSSSSSGSYGSSSSGSSEPWSSRPGYSYPSSSGGGGSMSKFFFYFVLVAGLGLVAALVVNFVVARRREEEWETMARAAEVEARHERLREQYASVAEAVAALRGADDAFSFVLFQDFLYALYAETHHARGEGKISRLGGYLSSAALRAYDVFPGGRVRGVVVGSMTVERVEVATINTASERSRHVECRVRFESNVTEGDEGRPETAWYQEEVWTLRRSPDAVSRPPERATVIGCPNCGAPLDKTVGGTCGYCGQAAGGGQFDWFVTSIRVKEREVRLPMLTGTTEEVGTDLPTLVADDARSEYQALAARDPDFTWAAFLGRLELVFGAFHAAWSEQALEKVRPYLTDALFQFQEYWVATYRRAKLRNVTEEPRILTVQLAKVVRDKYFDALTVRVYASCKDYTLDAAGEVVGGSKRKTREYSEYWTLVRSATRTGAPRTEAGCPNCGAPVEEINHAGVCGHCKVKVTTGEFDWVLSRIEQDEAYSG